MLQFDDSICSSVCVFAVNNKTFFLTPIEIDQFTHMYTNNGSWAVREIVLSPFEYLKKIFFLLRWSHPLLCVA